MPSKKHSPNSRQLNIFGEEEEYRNLVTPLTLYVRWVRSFNEGKVSASRGEGPYETMQAAKDAVGQGLREAKSFAGFVVESPMGKWEDKLYWNRWPSRP